MIRRIVECIPNFSEGRDPSVVDGIVAAIERGPGVGILGRTMDPDHNRSVVTFAGPPDAVAAAAVRGIAKAVETIDLTRHEGVHPRLGAADVVPFVPVRGVSLEDCVQLAERVAEEIWSALGVPSYFYEAAARRPERIRLENVRRGQFEGIREEVRRDPSRQPDIGGPELHATAGACIIGARKFLVAFNVNLATADVATARRIASTVRESSGGLPAVKALGLSLRSRGQAQVSMNLTDIDRTPVHAAFEAVRQAAEALGTSVASSEIIGLIPTAAVDRAAEFYLKCENFTPAAVLENRIAEVLPLTFDDILDELADPRRGAGGGSASARAGAMAASLCVLVCRLMKRNSEAFDAHRRFFAHAAKRDAEAFASLMRTAEPSEEAVIEGAEAPLAIAERASALKAEIDALLVQCPSRYSSDAVTAAGLAAAAEAGALSTVRLNLPAILKPEVAAGLESRLKQLER